MLVQIYRTLVDNSVENCRIGEKRHVRDVNTFNIKCQKVDEGVMVSDANVPVEHTLSLMTQILDSERKEEYADYMQASLLSLVELLDLPSVEPGDSVDPLNVVVLKLAWTNPIVVSEPHPPWKTKCIAVQVASNLGQSLTTESVLEVLDLALLDESEQVRIEALLSLPVIVLWSGLGASEFRIDSQILMIRSWMVADVVTVGGGDV
ncbi:hypothetical protein LWI28_020672 [Acer negundo]|uniref:Uncharacterized protein n=1 Tax=Acer negundo TaxID=4023 RepID=A0AAD5NYQ0_ACENE|nr:hypothetical protein LWI28_020672 [Acer negundo]